MTKLERAVADLRADLGRDKGGLVKVFADQLEAVLDALEGAPVVEPEAEIRVVESFDDLFKDKNGRYFIGINVRCTKKLDAYPSVQIGDEGVVVRHNYNSRYVYGVRFEGFAYTNVNVTSDEIEVAG
jgi:hypothetical protein